MRRFLRGQLRKRGVAVTIAGTLVAVLLLVAVGAYSEERLCALAAKPIPVVFEDGIQANVSAHVRPDFLWCGQAWRIVVESEFPLTIDIDEKWTALVPKGRVVIYSNHDSNNTGKFGTDEWLETPTRITVKEP